MKSRLGIEGIGHHEQVTYDWLVSVSDGIRNGEAYRSKLPN